MKRTYIASFTPNVDSSIEGYVLFEQQNIHTPVQVTFRLQGFRRVGQIHAIHIHEYGDLRQGCHSLGGHWNPHHFPHGSYEYDKVSHHAGDLINNLKVQPKHRFFYSYDDPLITLFGSQSILGRSVVIHANRDDLGQSTHPESKVNGNAGPRIACAIIGIAHHK